MCCHNKKMPKKASEVQITQLIEFIQVENREVIIMILERNNCDVSNSANDYFENYDKWYNCPQ